MRYGIILAVLIVAGCAGHATTLDASNGEIHTFDLTADQADHVLLAAFKEEFPSYSPTVVAGTIKSYTIRFTFMLDFQNIVASAVPVTVKSSDGHEHTEYAFQVDNNGSSFVQGKIYANNLFHILVRMATTEAAKRQ